MAALVLCIIGVIATPILLFIVHSSKDNTEQMKKPVLKASVARKDTHRKTCPRCGSPVMPYGDGGWECGWCGDYCWSEQEYKQSNLFSDKNDGETLKVSPSHYKMFQRR